jgi:hypothetical protein
MLKIKDYLFVSAFLNAPMILAIEPWNAIDSVFVCLRNV